MRPFVLGVFLVACQVERRGAPDAASGPDVRADSGSGGCPCAEIPTAYPACTVTCGNGQIDTCYVQSGMGCRCISIVKEACDTQSTCADAGYYGGTATCVTAFCSILEDSECDACPPSSRCETLPPLRINAYALSGNYLAAVATGKVVLFDGLMQVAEVAVDQPRDIVAIPGGGWLLLSEDPPSLSTLAVDGTRGPAHPVGSAVGASRMVAAADRVLLAWSTPSSINFAIVDPTGSSIVAPTPLMTAVADLGVASDGTSFFVGSGGYLAHIGPDGSRVVRPSFPGSSTSRTAVTWNGTAGWYLSGGVGQPFDATGAKVGAQRTLAWFDEPVAIAADGASLLAARFTTAKKLQLALVDGAGSVGTDIEVGGGRGVPRFVGKRGADILVAWSRYDDRLQLALVTP